MVRSIQIEKGGVETSFFLPSKLKFDKIEGENGFGYDPIFYFPPCKMTSAMMSMEEKNKHSHRAKALKKLYTILKEIL